MCCLCIYIYLVFVHVDIYICMNLYMNECTSVCFFDVLYMFHVNTSDNTKDDSLQCLRYKICIYTLQKSLHQISLPQALHRKISLKPKDCSNLGRDGRCHCWNVKPFWFLSGALFA